MASRSSGRWGTASSSGLRGALEQGPARVVTRTGELANGAAAAGAASACRPGLRTAHSAQGTANAVIARMLSLHLDSVRRWRKRLTAEELAALEYRPRPGHSRRYAPKCIPLGRVSHPRTRCGFRSRPAETATPVRVSEPPESRRRLLRRGEFDSRQGSLSQVWGGAIRRMPSGDGCGRSSR
ncbi:helix-turn-helix domain-containing protein [Streptomyces sp. NPDC050147]|uniref:helix-turn-helix domain-containing protein n=1 Tax=Streptomyces sp. NPDC050147 TaxID=3155513 RepID=UPI0034284FCB